MGCIVSIVITVIGGMVIYFVNKIILEKPADDLKKWVDEIRQNAKTKKQQKHRQMLIIGFVDGVRGYGISRLMLMLGLCLFLISVTIIAIFAVGSILAATISPTPFEQITATWILLICALLFASTHRKIKDKFITPSEISAIVGARVSIVIDVMRDIATKGELRRLALLRIETNDEESLLAFFTLLYKTAEKYEIHDHVAPFIIWSEEFTADFKNLPESGKQLCPEEIRAIKQDRSSWD